MSRLLAALTAAVLSIALAPPAHADHREVTVLRVIDGDTLDVVASGYTRERVRLLRVDTPERGARGAEDATDALARFVAGTTSTTTAKGDELRRLAAGRSVALDFETPDSPERDRYGRLLAYVYSGGRMLNLALVEAGWSRYLTRWGRGRHAQAFEQAERSARAAKRGLWACGCLR